MCVRRIFGAMAVVAALQGCSLFEDDEPEAPVVEAPQVVLEPVNVQAVRNLELGTTRRGILLTAYGTAPGLGYSAPALVARRGGQPGADGVLDYDFVVTPPPPNLGLEQGTPRARSVRADAEIRPEIVRGARGVRVHAAVGGLAIAF